jgi:beta-lactamase regulating signal transducer with metallopeptidase domain
MTAADATRWVDYATLWGFNTVLAATLVMVVALAATAFARRTPALRNAMLCSCLAVLTATPFLALLVPATGYSLWAWNSSAWSSPEIEAMSPPRDASSRTTRDDDPTRAARNSAHGTAGVARAGNVQASTAQAPLPTDNALTARFDDASEDVPSVASEAAEGRASQQSFHEPFEAAAREMAPWLVALWIAGALVGLLRLGVAWNRLNAIIRAARPAVGSPETILAECRGLLGVDRDIALVASDRIASPFAAGIGRACIVLPTTWAARASRDQLRTVLLHEAAHVARRDPAIVLMQQLAAAFYWFHPLVRLFNARLAEAREETCDNHVLAAIDAPAYSRTLLTLAQVVQPLRPLPAAAGLFASRWRLEHRIAGLLDERRDRATRLASRSKAIVGMLAFATTTGAALVAGTLASAQSPAATAVPAPNSAVPALPSPATTPAIAAADVPSSELLARAAEAAVRTMQSIETAHVRFRRTLITGPFKPGVTPARCAELLAKYDLAARPDSLRDLLVEILATETVAAAPWSVYELHTAHPGTAKEMVRETRHIPQRDPDVHVVTPEISLRWDEANSQLNIDAARDNRYGYSRLANFWMGARPELARGPGVVALQNIDGRLVLRIDAAGSTALIDEETGLFLSIDSQRRGQTRWQRWLGWRAAAGGVSFPAAAIDLQFAEGQLRSIGASLVDEVRVNQPLSPATFTLGAPAGTVVVDSRNGQHSVVRINRDVFDITSAELVEEASKPLKQEPTPTELAAFDDLRKMYVLADGDVLRRLGPPYPMSRKYLMRMLAPHAADQRRGTPHAIIEWKDGHLGKRRYSYSGFAPKLEHLIGVLLEHPPADIEIPDDVLGVELPGDYIVREGATRDDLAAALSTIASQELGKAVRLQFQEQNREVYVARGSFAVDFMTHGEYGGQPLIAINGGDHNGDHGESLSFGKIAEMLREVSGYADVKIVNETTLSDRNLAWSKRWYDRDSTPADKRFKLDPKAVLDLVSKQTGITFERQTRTVNVLTLAKP